MLRTSLQFGDLEKLKSVDTTPAWKKSDDQIAGMEGASNVEEARTGLTEPTKAALLQIHSILFRGREGAGSLRQSKLAPLYRGHDCPEPQYIDHSLDNFVNWLTAESLAEIHPIEKAALVLTRIVDIWPFEFGNLTAGVVFGNFFLRDAGLAPFSAPPEQMKEFNTAIAQAMMIDTQPLVNAIYKTVKREMDALAKR